MRLQTTFGNPENVAGEWHAISDKAGEPGRLKVRAVPDSELTRLRHRYYGKRQTVRTSRDGYRELDFDDETTLGFATEKAVYALLDSEDMYQPIGDDDAARLATQALGRPVAKGEDVPLDGKWTDAVKRWIFGVSQDFVRIVNEISDEMGEALKREKSGLGKT